MTTITIAREGKRKQIRCSGHAEYANGPDICCAGISAVIQSYAYFMQDLADKGLTKIEKMWIGEGLVDVIADTSCLEAEVAYTMTMQGLCAINESYPDNTEIIIKDKIE